MEGLFICCASQRGSGGGGGGGGGSLNSAKICLLDKVLYSLRVGTWNLEHGFGPSRSIHPLGSELRWTASSRSSRAQALLTGKEAPFLGGKKLRPTVDWG